MPEDASAELVASPRELLAGGVDVKVDVDLQRQTITISGKVAEGLHSLITLPAEAKSLKAWIPDIELDDVGVQFSPLNATSFGVYATAGPAGAQEPSAQAFLGSVALPAGGGSAFVIGLTVGSAIDLGATPLFGSMLTGIGVSDIQVSYASEAIPEGAVVLPPPAPARKQAYLKGFSLQFTLTAGGAQEHFSLTPSTPKPKPPPSLGGAAKDGDEAESPPVLWFTLAKTFGPLTIDRIGIISGVAVDGVPPRFGIALDASVKLTSLGVSLREFAVTFPQQNISIGDIDVSLAGLDVAFKSSSLQLQGSLVRNTKSPYPRYDGSVTIRAGQYGLVGVGSFAQFEGAPSLFVFGVVEGPFGGPPAFYVTGIAAGFGLRRDLRLPTTSEVDKFPLIAAARGGGAKSPDDAMKALDEGGWIPPKAGSYWVAAGVQFTSFELLRGVALLSVQFGNELVIALLGSAKMRMPKEANARAYAEVGLMLDAVVRPADGTVKVNALLTPDSYVIDPACHLSGGFAFYTWFGGNEHAGDFVLSLGGYHPVFKRPEWYPDVPRLAFDWKVSSEVRISGEAYFALTPSCVMAGGALTATFSSGDLRAWFVAYADFLIYWSPFYFEVSIGVSVGVSYTLDLWFVRKTFSIDLSASVELWGPPLAGVARINWWVISFTVYINGGTRPALSPTLADWPTFEKAFLPAPPKAANANQSTVCRPRIDGGLLGTADDHGVEVWVVRPAALAIVTETVVPATEIVITRPSAVGNRTVLGKPSGVYPLGSVTLRGTHVVRLATVDGDKTFDIGTKEWTWKAIDGGLPSSMWGRTNTGKPALAADVVDAVVGVRGVAPEPTIAGPPSVNVAHLRTELTDRAWPPPPTPRPWPTRPPALPTPVDDTRVVIAETVASEAVVATRMTIVGVVARAVQAPLHADGQVVLAREVQYTFPAFPKLRLLGQPAPSTMTLALPLAGRGQTRAAATPAPAPTGPVLRGAVRQFCRARPNAEWWVGPHTWGSTHAADASADRRDRAMALSFLEGPGQGASCESGVTLVWDVPPWGLAAEVAGDLGARVVAFDDQYRVLSDMMVGAGGATDAVVLDGAGRVAVTGLAPGPADAAMGWVGTSALVQVSPQALLAERAVVRPQSPARLRLGPWDREVGVTSGRAMVERNLTSTGVGTVPGWVETTFAEPCATVAVLLRAADDEDAEHAPPDAAQVWMQDEPADPVTTSGTTARAWLTYDVARFAAPLRVLVEAPVGWRLDGVVGTARRARTATGRAFAVYPAARSGAPGRASLAWR